ncbi:MAG TPA: hypothetical protein VJ867_04630 [Gemmatimonadaceae bacterium]|nr:hypothetical protein [Gemmatimonadaceae bacterium]
MDAGFHNLQRQLAALLPGETWLESSPPLELTSMGVDEAPRLISATLLEDRTLRAHTIAGDVEPHFAAFLDGTQRSRVIAHAGEVPIVHGVIAAVVRQRVERRLGTWRAPIVRGALYAPLGLLGDVWRDALRRSRIDVVDTLDAKQGDSQHPFALQDAAIHAIQRAREAAERELAEAWCAAGDGDLFLDGSVTGSDAVATSSRAVGVVKTHRTLYAEGDALRTVLRLHRAERSSIFRITSPRRTPVASWYLRVRDPRGHDPLWGLVRVEVAEAHGNLPQRADDVSRWVLAEALPLAVPDGRWDKMMYGIRDCEEFLRAIQ